MAKFKVAVEPSPVASQETGKQRALRIGLDYFKSKSSLQQTKRTLWIVALAVSVPIGGYLLIFNQGWVSRGPVAGVHAAWDNNCQACHDGFSGIGLSRLWGGSVSHETSDAKCKNCHSGAEHHAAALEPAGASCGSCHREHRGRDASLVRLGDNDCTSCHVRLDKHVKDGKPRYKNEITAFSHDHFELPKSDPGNIKFNHAKHLKPGQEIEWTLENIKKDDPAAYARYRSMTLKNTPAQKDKGDKALVALSCNSCHVLDSGDAGGEGFKASGAYFPPVNFDANCRACHALTFDSAAKVTVKDGEGNAVEVPRQAPHRVQPADLRSYLWGVYADLYLKEKGLEQFKKDLESDVNPPPTRPLPGKGAAVAKQNIDESIARAVGELFKSRKEEKGHVLEYGCLKCHYVEETKETKRVAPSSIPLVWQTHARFNHAAHRSMKCASCHKDVEQATYKDAVMLPDAKTCYDCHSAAGGVRHDCTGCHNYHNGDQPAQGLGATTRNPSENPSDLLTTDQLLKGRK